MLPLRKILCPTEAMRHRPTGPIGQDLAFFSNAEFEILAVRTDPGWHIAIKFIGQPLDPGPDFLHLKFRAQQAHPAVAVVTNAARRNDPFVHVESRDPADRKAVTPVDIGHGNGRSDNPGQGGDIAHLIQSLLLFQSSDHVPAGEDQAVGAHRPLAGNPPATFIDLLQFDTHRSSL